MSDNEKGAHTSAPSPEASFSLSTSALCAATISYAILPYIAYGFVGLAFITGAVFLFKKDKSSIPDYWWRILFPMLPFFFAGVLFLAVGDPAATHLGLMLAIGSPILSVAFSRTPVTDKRGALLYSIFIAAILTLWMGLQNEEWSADATWRILDSIPTEILVLYLLFYFFDRHLYYIPRIFLVLCIRFSLSRLSALIVLLLLTLFWLIPIVLLIYFGHTLFLLAILPLLLLPHLYSWVNYFRSNITRFTLWVIVTVVFLFGLSYVAHLLDTFYTPQYRPATPYELTTANGRPYTHDTTTNAFRNGYYYDIYVCRQELEHEWPRYSGVALNTEYAPGHTVYDALCRYLASDGHRRDSVGLTFLESADIAAIERGATSKELRDRGTLYWAIWNELEGIETARQNGNVKDAPILLAWNSVVEGDTSIESPIGIIASARRWGVLPVAFFVLAVVGSLVFIAIRYKRKQAGHFLYIFLLASLCGYSTFTVHGMFFLMIAVWWTIRYQRPPKAT